MIVELYAGAGGAALGIRDVCGAEPAICVDYDVDCVETLRAAGFVAQRSDVGATLPNRSWRGRRPAWWPSEPVSLLWASPPCQPWSRAGLGLGATDARDQWPATRRAIALLRPERFCIENVRGAPVSAWAEQLAALPGGGYRVACWLLDAADFGVPQHRWRWFVVGVRGGAGPLLPPRRGHGPPGSLFWPSWVTIADALPHVLEEGTVWGGGRNPTAAAAYWLTRPAPAVLASEDHGARHQNYDPERTPMRASDALWRSTGRRRLTPEECAALQSFPPGHPFRARTQQSLYRQIGNAVPRPLAQAVVAALVQA